jgi:hypothetical protein
MKNILTSIAFYALLPLVGITYLIVDNYRALRRKKPEHNFVKYDLENVVYPDDPAKDFNEWINFIHNQLK